MQILVVSKDELHQGRIQDFETGGEWVQVTVKYQRVAYSHTHAQRFFPLNEFGGSPKGGFLTPKIPPPLDPLKHTMMHTIFYIRDLGLIGPNRPVQKTYAYHAMNLVAMTSV